MNLSQTLTQILSNFNSTYDAAQEISLQTGEPLGTIHKRLSVWLKKDPETWVKIQQTLNCLGYQLVLTEISEGETQIIWENTKPKGNYTMSLQEYLSNLNSSDSQWGIWVNPDNVDDYRVGQFCFENGGISDNKICIGSLDKLSFGFQSQHEAIAHYLKENHLLVYKGRKVKVNQAGILQAWSDGYLDEDFSEFLEDEAKSVMEIWSQCEAEDFVMNKIPEIIEQALKDAEEESSYAYQWEE